MSNNLKLKIGDIVFLLIPQRGIYAPKVTAPYHLFLTEGNSEVILRFRHGSAFQGDNNLPGEILFDTQPNWRLYYSNKKYIVQTRDRTAVLTPNFTSGDVYMIKNQRGFPFTYPLDELLMINLLAQGRGVMVHAFGVMDTDNGLLFAGTSGAGKSTLSNLWNDKKDATVLSDDRIIVRKMNGRFWIYGTPWHGDARVCSPEKAPLEKIFFLKHAEKNEIKKMSQIDATSRMIVRSFSAFWDKKGMEFTLGFIEELTREVPCYELGFLPDEGVIDLVRNI